jgi:hypothetical protein
VRRLSFARSCTSGAVLERKSGSHGSTSSRRMMEQLSRTVRLQKSMGSISEAFYLILGISGSGAAKSPASIYSTSNSRAVHANMDRSTLTVIISSCSLQNASGPCLYSMGILILKIPSRFAVGFAILLWHASLGRPGYARSNRNLGQCGLPRGQICFDVGNARCHQEISPLLVATTISC